MRTLLSIVSVFCACVISASAVDPEFKLLKDSDGNEIVMIGAKVFFGPNVNAPSPTPVEPGADDSITVGEWFGDNWGKCLVGAAIVGGTFLVCDNNGYLGMGDKGSDADAEAGVVAPPIPTVAGDSIVVTVGDNSPVTIYDTDQSYNVGARLLPRMSWRPDME